ncbi:hypothetical protein [Kitasatospora sp. NPDC054795]
MARGRSAVTSPSGPTPPGSRRLLAGAGRGDRALRPDRRPARRLRSRSTGVHSWRYQNVGLISLDGNDVCYNTPANLDCTKGKQKKWLESRLTALRADTGIDFIVVYPHQCTYSTCHDNGAELGAQQDWAPLFDKYQVDPVLSGHNQTVKVTWSRVRYTGYCLVAVEVTPAAAGRPARMEVRSLTEDGTAVDRATVQRG